MNSKTRSRLASVHAAAGAVAILCIASFWKSTVIVELSFSHQGVVVVKTGILYGLILLIPSLATAGATGNILAGSHPGGLVQTKARRMKIIAANGLLVLVPCAIGLWWMATHDLWDGRFYIVQTIELIAGAVNLSLLVANFRDGLKLRTLSS